MPAPSVNMMWQEIRMLKSRVCNIEEGITPEPQIEAWIDSDTVFPADYSDKKVIYYGIESLSITPYATATEAPSPTQPSEKGKFIYDFRYIADADLNDDTLMWVVGDHKGILYQANIGQMKGLLDAAIQKPLIGVVGRGLSIDPVAGTSTYTNSNLAGFGSFIALIDGSVWQNFGNFGNQFTFNTGTGSMTFPSMTWRDGMSLYIDMNQ